MTQPPPLPGAVRTHQGWWRRHWRWALPLAVLVPGAAAAAVVWWGLVQWSQWIRGSEPYLEAMRRAHCSVALVAELGEPIQDGFLPMGDVAASGDGSASSQLVVQLHGPQGRGRLFLRADRAQGQWDYPILYVVTEASETIDLTALDDAEAAQQCALRECRESGECLLTASL